MEYLHYSKDLIVTLPCPSSEVRISAYDVSRRQIKNAHDDSFEFEALFRLRVFFYLTRGEKSTQDWLDRKHSNDCLIRYLRTSSFFKSVNN